MSSLLTVTAITVAAVLVCAVQAIRARRLLVSAMWLAGASAATALLMYVLGAAEVAVIELSVGAGLVTVLFVFAINIAGDEPIVGGPRVPRPLAWVVTVGSLALLAYFTLPRVGVALPLAGTERFATALWEHRAADVLLQVVLVFAGVLGVIGLLSEEAASGEAGTVEQSAHAPRTDRPFDSPDGVGLAQGRPFDSPEGVRLAQGRPFDSPEGVRLAQGRESV